MKPKPYAGPLSISNYWGKHTGEDIYVVGTGTSLENFDFSHLKGKITIGLNAAIKYLPLTYHLYSDTQLFRQYLKLKFSSGTVIVCQNTVAKNAKETKYDKCKFKDQLRVFHHTSRAKGITKEDNGLFVNSTVATGGLMMAYKLGAKRIFIMGVDGYCYKDKYYLDGSQKPNNKNRKHEVVKGKIIQDRHTNWDKQMSELKVWFDEQKFENVFNLNPLSEIKAWQKVPPEEVFNE